MLKRGDGRGAEELRPILVELGAQRYPEGSVLYRCGGTTVLVSASVSEGVRDFLRGTGRGWVTAEYEMHPRANPQRRDRERARRQIDGRTQEIQRLIGRALRSAVVPEKLGERTITIDCDVLDADGGTRTASITGGFIALAIALHKLTRDGRIPPGTLRSYVGAISVGQVDGQALVDLCYQEDKVAHMDLNVVATAEEHIIEVQGTAEAAPVPRAHLDRMIDLALRAMPQLVRTQQEALIKANVNPDRLLSPA